nr:NAD(P)-dependent alcohol dehydrogenase [Actinomadura sp. RB99]
MRAVRYERYGPPDVLQVHKVPVPQPGKGEVLIRVHATSVNPAEAQVRAGKMRVMSGFRFPKGTGEDFTGQIVAAGPGVDSSVVGRRVWGSKVGLNSATAAEYICLDESLTAPAPVGHDLVTAAALPTVGLTALLALRTVGLHPEHSLLVVGASGGVGSATVQLAAAKGARVTTISSGANTDLCLGLGAEQAYAHELPEQLPAGQEFDAVIDLNGTSMGTYRRRLRQGGRMASLSAKGMGYAMLSALLPGPRARMARMKPTRAHLNELADHVERGDLRPVLHKVYAMEEIAEAHRSMETGHSRGKRVVRIADDPEF